MSRGPGTVPVMVSSWRLRAVEGAGWVERAEGAKAWITADPMAAHQWPTRAHAEAAAAELRMSVPVRAVEGTRFGRRIHGSPTP